MSDVKNKKPKTGCFYVYMVRCQYGTYYAGYTIDLLNRLKKHNEGTGAKYLRGKGPVTLVYLKQYRSLTQALQAEAHLKSLTRSEKENLIKKQGTLTIC